MKTTRMLSAFAVILISTALPANAAPFSPVIISASLSNAVHQVHYRYRYHRRHHHHYYGYSYGLPFIAFGSGFHHGHHFSHHGGFGHGGFGHGGFGHGRFGHGEHHGHW